jgi:hypothetical protein
MVRSPQPGWQAIFESLPGDRASPCHTDENPFSLQKRAAKKRPNLYSNQKTMMKFVLVVAILALAVAHEEGPVTSHLPMMMIPLLPPLRAAWSDTPPGCAELGMDHNAAERARGYREQEEDGVRQSFHERQG